MQVYPKLNVPDGFKCRMEGCGSIGSVRDGDKFLCSAHAKQAEAEKLRRRHIKDYTQTIFSNAAGAAAHEEKVREMTEHELRGYFIDLRRIARIAAETLFDGTVSHD